MSEKWAIKTDGLEIDAQAGVIRVVDHVGPSESEVATGDVSLNPTVDLMADKNLINFKELGCDAPFFVSEDGKVTVNVSRFAASHATEVESFARLYNEAKEKGLIDVPPEGLTRTVQMNLSTEGMQPPLEELAKQVAMLVNQSNVEIAAMRSQMGEASAPLHGELAALKARVSMLEASFARSNAT